MVVVGQGPLSPTRVTRYDGGREGSYRGVTQHAAMCCFRYGGKLFAAIHAGALDMGYPALTCLLPRDSE